MQHREDRRSRMGKRYLHLLHEEKGNSTETPFSHDKPVGSALSGLDWQKSYFNHRKLIIMARSLTNGPTFKSFNSNNQIKKEPSFNIERSNACMKCRNRLTKEHLNVCPVKETTCKNYNYKGYFAFLRQSRNKRTSVKTVTDNHVITENCMHVPPESSWSENQETCGVNENGQSDDDSFSVLSVSTIYGKNGLETEKL